MQPEASQSSFQAFHIGLTKIKCDDFTRQLSFTTCLVCGIYIYLVYFVPMFVAVYKLQCFAVRPKT